MQKKFLKWPLWILFVIIWAMVGMRMWEAYSAITPNSKKKNIQTLQSTSLAKTSFTISANYPDPFQDQSKSKQKSKPIKSFRSPKKHTPVEEKINFKYLGRIRAGTKEMALIDLGDKHAYLHIGASIGPWRIKSLTDQILIVETRAETKNIKIEKIKN